MVSNTPNYTLLNQIFPKIKEFALTYYSPLDDFHGLGHIKRVLRNAYQIHKKIGGNWELIKSIVWLHDIGRMKEKTHHKNHAILSKELAKVFLDQFDLNPNIKKSILHGIITHSFSVGEIASSLEAKIVSDADKLDALGAIGIYRVCAFQTLRNEGLDKIIEHCYSKLFKLPQKLYLPISKKIAKQRSKILEEFVEKLEEELNLVS